MTAGDNENPTDFDSFAAQRGESRRWCARRAARSCAIPAASPSASCCR